MQLLQNQNFHIALPIFLAILMNGLVYGLNIVRREPKKDSKRDTIILPPGYIIGIVWIIIFGFLGYAHYLLYKIKNKLSWQCYLLEIFVLFCVSYPVVTQFKKNESTIMNYVSLLFSFIIALVIMNVSLKIFWYLIPLLLWISYVNLYTIVECVK